MSPSIEALFRFPGMGLSFPERFRRFPPQKYNFDPLDIPSRLV
jgi:hypothetical protein